MQQIFIMMVGLPASGKTTVARDLVEARGDELAYLSSDDIRAELGNPGNDAVFAEMHRRMLDAVCEGRSVVFDATNLNRKKRMNTLSMLSARGLPRLYRVYYALDTPFALCMERNARRDGATCVPDTAMRRMLASFNIPIEAEGVDHIYWVSDEEVDEWLFRGNRTVALEDADGFDQENHHHAFPLGKHMTLCESNVREFSKDSMDDVRRNALLYAARYHDIGKLLTKTHMTFSGVETDDAHYYGHDCAGAYLWLSELFRDTERWYDWRTVERTALLIELHMRPYSAKSDGRWAKRTSQMLGDDFVADLWRLHEADRAAH